MADDDKTKDKPGEMDAGDAGIISVPEQDDRSKADRAKYDERVGAEKAAKLNREMYGDAGGFKSTEPIGEEAAMDQAQKPVVADTGADTPLAQKVATRLKAARGMPPPAPPPDMGAGMQAAYGGIQSPPPEPVSAQSPAAPDLAATPLPPPQPTRDQELEDAVRETQMRHKVGMLFQLFGIQPANMDAPLQDLQNKRQLQREHQADVEEQQAADPASMRSRMTQALAIKMGWAPEDARTLTAKDSSFVLQGGNAMALQEERKQTNARETARDTQTAAYHQQEVDRQKARDAAEDKYRQGELGLRRAEIEAKKEKPAAVVKINPDVEKTTNQALAAFPSIDELEQKHLAVGGSALIPGINVGGKAELADATHARSAQIGSAEFPGVRGTAAAEKVEKNQPPAASALIAPGRVKDFYQEQRATIADRLEEQISTEEARGVDMSEQRAKLEAIKKRYNLGKAGVSGGGLAAQKTGGGAGLVAEGSTSVSKSGVPIIFRGGKWVARGG